ncbi:hypothetical protein [Butyrivibrio sp. AE3004]|uniref:hypothetical protein n=1 Tax=Butyrivibrio sp. AE3004 TaxID=1506994 RepID=UPI0004947741|nr:hypothetical protein [Butyrivibrio sp. AE3004]
MKKRIVATMLCLMVGITGCSSATPDTNSGPGTADNTQLVDPAEEASTDNAESDSAEAESSEEAEEATATEEAADAEAQSGKYSNKIFEITIPDELKDIVKVDVTDDKIDVFHKESLDAGFGGYEVGIWAVADPKEYAGGPFTKLGEISNEDGEVYDVIKCMPSEIQWDYNLEDEPEDFKKLDEAESAILSSITGVNGFTYAEGAGMKGADLYNTVLAKYVKAVTEGWDADKLERENISPEFYNIAIADDGQGLDGIGYAFADVNVDGIDEMFIGPLDGGDNTIAYDIYTIVDHKPAFVVSGGARNRYYNDDNHFIANEWSGGAAQSGFDLYGISSNDTEMILQYSYKYDGYENENEPWFKAYEPDKYESITEKEFDEGVAGITDNYVKFDFTPLSKNEDAKGLAENEEAVEASEAKIPAYEYPGPEAFYSVLYKYIITTFSGDYEKADVGIPCPIIVAEDESDKDDIKVYGDFKYYNYELKGDTLEMVSGGSYPGCMHLKNTDAGYEVTDIELVEDGSDFTPSAKKIFGDHYDEFMKVYSDGEKQDEIRAQIIANYVAANKLSITQFKDYGWDPVKLPEENIDSFYSQLN